ncbi:MAG TPA: glycosyltransferase family 4 protein [Kiritimatiellia bacterium]|nr:glycosyltransferase family 4 protein [Kiritimatiellia bacterium]HQQ03495.1 glycosyltransferase family 4 protein [Kiritimatiellia bacterium]
MKIAFVKQKYVPFGGGELYLERLAGACRDRGDEVHLITAAWPGNRVSAFTVHPVPVRNWSHASVARSFSHNLKEIIRSVGFDVVFSLDRTEQQHIWRAGEGAHPVWLDRRGEFEPAWKVRLARLSSRQRTLLKLERRCVSRTPVIIANSQMVKNDLENCYDLSGKRVEIIHNGVDFSRFSPDGREEARTQVRSRLQVNPAVPLLLFAGSGFRRKGLPELMRALRGVPDAVLLVIGRDKSAPWIRLAASLGVSGRVRFLAPSESLPELYRAADVTVFPTWFDSFGFVGLESMACGTPLVTTPFAGVSELVREGVNGAVIARPDAADELAAAIQDQVSRKDRSRAIADSVREYSLENNIRRTLAVIDDTAFSRKS